jgi:hypothetical protein
MSIEVIIFYIAIGCSLFAWWFFWASERED